jgi:hypothetical protein
MAKRTAGKMPEERAATVAEVEAAIDALSDADWYRLRDFAERRAFLLNEKARGAISWARLLSASCADHANGTGRK